jgi:hypothetical protein
MATTLKINANRLKIIRNPLPNRDHTAPTQAFSSRRTDV